MKIGIVGFAGSGKTTLFNALTGQEAPTGYGAGKVNLGTLKVRDRRVDRLAELDRPRKTTYAEITFADVPGGRGAATLDPKTLGRIREMDALVQVLRGFEGADGPPDPTSEIGSFEDELIIADMEVAERRVERLRKDRSDPRQQALLEACLKDLEEGRTLRSSDLSKEDRRSLGGFAMLTLKPVMAVLSLPEGEAVEGLPPDLAEVAGERGLSVMPLCGAIESEIAALDPEDQAEILADLGLEVPATERFAKAAWEMLELLTFLTHGPDECRAWPLRRGSTAVEAAGTVHSDMARGFIRAEVMTVSDLVRVGSEREIKAQHLMRQEPKDYVVQDGDILLMRFSV